jgi:hypothetical protein
MVLNEEDDMTHAQRFHHIACSRLGIDPNAHGSQAEIADTLKIKRSQYGSVLRGHRTATLKALSAWAGKLGLCTVVSPDGEVRFREPDCG